MKTIVKEEKIYNFEELEKEIQERLINEKKESLEDTYVEYDLLEDMEYFAKRLLKKYFGEKAEFKNVLYDLSYCQGSGAMIEFDLSYYNKFVEVRNFGGYMHENSFIIVGISPDNNCDLTEKQESKLKEKIYKMNCELKNYGYSQIEYWWKADDTAIEDLKEYEFYENGEIYWGC